ncbi:MAG TPA: glycosyltransferase family 4 protein [Rubricoccaceae bacterium]|jgi:glycosyltransferase involved in cell wall biosynthesis
MEGPSLHVVGRFPPPLDGQALATERLASLLEAPDRRVARVNVGAPEGDHVVTTLQAGRAAHFWRQRRHLRAALAAEPDGPVLWPSVSPSTFGHLRDRLVVVPAFGPSRSVVGVVHRGDFAQLFERTATRASGIALMQRLAGVVFLTEGLADRCAPWIPDAKRLVIPNTIDDAAIPGLAEVEAARAERAERLAGPHPEIRLLYLSGLVPSKGYPDVLDALAVLRGRGADARATFAGRWASAEAERSFSARTAALGVSAHVTVAGAVSDRAAVRRLYHSHDLFLLPTAYPIEAQPLTVIEALAAGTPVVVTRHAGLPEMVTGGREAEFVGHGAPEQIADAALTLVARWSSASQQARSRFDAAFAPDAVRDHWMRLLATLPSK